MNKEEKNIIDGGPALPVPDHMSFSRIIFDNIKLGGKKIAQICPHTDESMTFEEILQKSVNMATGLKNLNITKGDTIAICSENRFEFMITALGAAFTGATLATISPTYAENECEHTLSLIEPSYIACSPRTVEGVARILPKLPSVKSLILFGDNQLVPGLLYTNLISTQADMNNFQPYPTRDEDIFIILFSSGTTGLPKGVMVTHSNLVHDFNCQRLRFEVAKVMDPILSILPWYHSFGFIMMIHHLIRLQTFLFVIQFKPEVFLRAIQTYKVKFLLVVPPVVVFLAKHPLVTKYDLSSLGHLLSGAAPLSAAIVNLVHERIGLKNICQGYGLTETPMAITINFSHGKKIGSIGPITYGMKGKVTDIETGKALGPNEIGELCFKSPNIMKGYLKNKAATDDMFDEHGFIHTGDIGYYDEDKYFFIIDRLKELIKYKGFQVPPAELEGILLQHPDVQECGVVGLPDECAGELPLAFVVRQPNSEVTEKELVDFVASKISDAKHLRGGVRFIDHIPKNPSGKILRRKLREHAVKLS